MNAATAGALFWPLYELKTDLFRPSTKEEAKDLSAPKGSLQFLPKIKKSKQKHELKLVWFLLLSIVFQAHTRPSTFKDVQFASLAVPILFTSCESAQTEPQEVASKGRGRRSTHQPKKESLMACESYLWSRFGSLCSVDPLWPFYQVGDERILPNPSLPDFIHRLGKDPWLMRTSVCGQSYWRRLPPSLRVGFVSAQAWFLYGWRRFKPPKSVRPFRSKPTFLVKAHFMVTSSKLYPTLSSIWVIKSYYSFSYNKLDDLSLYLSFNLYPLFNLTYKPELLDALTSTHLTMFAGVCIHNRRCTLMATNLNNVQVLTINLVLSKSNSSAQSNLVVHTKHFNIHPCTFVVLPSRIVWLFLTKATTVKIPVVRPNPYRDIKNKINVTSIVLNTTQRPGIGVIPHQSTNVINYPKRESKTMLKKLIFLCVWHSPSLWLLLRDCTLCAAAVALYVLVNCSVMLGAFLSPPVLYNLYPQLKTNGCLLIPMMQVMVVDYKHDNPTPTTSTTNTQRKAVTSRITWRRQSSRSNKIRSYNGYDRGNLNPKLMLNSMVCHHTVTPDSYAPKRKRI